MWQWLLKLFGFGKPDSSARPRQWPTREEIMELPWFEGMEMDRIAIIETPEGAKRAYDEISSAAVVGFDTESQPTFNKGEASKGPHVAQFATPERAYVFTLHQPENRKVVSALMELTSLKKVGFGLSDDVKRMRTKLRANPQSVVDLETLFAKHGYGRGVGAKVGVALCFKQRFRKSKKIGTSSWGRHQLSDAQILYAANDAYAAIRVFDALNSKGKRR